MKTKKQIGIGEALSNHLSNSFSSYTVKTEQITLKNGVDLIFVQIATPMGMKFILLDLRKDDMRFTTVESFANNEVEFLRKGVIKDMARIIEFVDSFPYLYGSDIARQEVEDIMQVWKGLRNLPSENILVKREHKISR